MKYAIIKDGVVDNIILASAEFAASIGAVDCPDGGIGYTYKNGVFTAPAPVAAPVPSSVSPRQIRQALTRSGLRAAVETAVAAGDQDLKDWWEFATEFQRSNQHVIDMGVALGVSEQQLDDLWTLAGSL